MVDMRERWRFFLGVHVLMSRVVESGQTSLNSLTQDDTGLPRKRTLPGGGPVGVD